MRNIDSKKSFAAKYPLLASQWHPELNSDVTPDMIFLSDRNDYWWLLPYDDPKTGKHFDFVWQASPLERIKMKGAACPFLNGKAVWPGFNDLASNFQELEKEWHPTKNGTLKPTDVTCGKNIKVWWYLPYDDSETGLHFDFEWEAWIRDRVQGAKCPYLTGNAVWPGFNDLATKAQELAKQWHPVKNGELKPTEITCNHHNKVWWLYPYDDPITGKHFDFEWEASPNSRMTNSGCPFLSGKAVWPGFNDLESRYPEIAKQWHPTENKGFFPNTVSCSSNKSFVWLLPYDDPITGMHFDFVWKAKVENRTLLGEECPFLAPSPKVWTGFNDLAKCYPEIAAEFHPTKNRRKTPDKIYKSTPTKYWWKCPKCGKSWFASVKSRVDEGALCSRCRRQVNYGI